MTSNEELTEAPFQAAKAKVEQEHQQNVADAKAKVDAAQAAALKKLSP